MSQGLTPDDFTAIIEQMNEAALVTDTDGVIVYANRHMASLSGYSIDEMIGRSPSLFRSGRTPHEVHVRMWETIRAGKPWSGRILNKRKARLPMRIAGGDDKEQCDEYWAFLTVTPILDADGEIRFFAATQRDVSEKVRLERQLDYEREEATARADISEIMQSKRPLKARLAESLERLVRLDGIEVENKCGIFLIDGDSGFLDLHVLHGEFTPEFIEREQRIPLGNCLCGRVAESGEIIVSDDCFCDERHENSFVGMTRHGHYIIPLRSFGETIGTMFLYTEPHPIAASHRLETLQAVADSMALAVVNDRIEKQLLEASVTASAASSAKSEFLANMSHEIRTPLNGILGFTEMLRRDGGSIDDEERGECIEVIHASGLHLLGLINNILDLSKVEAGQLDVEAIETKPVEILSDLMSTMRVQAGEKALSLDLLCQGPQPSSILSDPTRLRQILTNLIGNALKFTDRGGVTVRSRVDEDDGLARLVVDVIDTGAGIPPEKLATLFEPFTQADSSITRRFGGTGLGLAISKRLAEALGGTLTVYSQPGNGSTFTLTIPLGSVDEVNLDTNTHGEAVRSPRPKRSAITDAAPPLEGHVLLVDDGETNRRLIRKILKRAGARVTSAENGQEAFELASAEPFDLILMDMQMPVMDGYSATRAIREHGVTTPIIALTASAMKGDRERCVEAGCNDYLTKPVDIRELIETSANWLREASSPEPPAAAGQSDTVSSVLLDDPDLRGIVFDYVDQLSGRVEQIEETSDTLDYEQLAGHAHLISGSGGMVGFDDLSRISAALEHAALNKQADRVGRMVRELRLETERILSGIAKTRHP